MVQLEGVKAVFSEPRHAGDDFDSTIRRYYEAVDEGRGGLFMAVCRGKVRLFCVTGSFCCCNQAPSTGLSAHMSASTRARVGCSW